MSSPEKIYRPPSLAGRHVYLRPITSDDYSWMQRAELSGDLAMRWRFRGSTPSPEVWAQAIWGGALAQFIVTETGSDHAVGVVAVYRANFQHNHAALAAARFDTDASPVMVLGMALFIRYTFTCWSFRKLYMEIPEFNFPQIASGVGRLFEIEGRLRDHNYFDGQLWDEVILAIHRDTWDREGRWLMAAA